MENTKVKLSISLGGLAHPPFEYPSMENALEDIRTSLKRGFYRRMEKDLQKEGFFNRCIYQLGPGSSLHVMTEKRMAERVAEQQRLQMEIQQRSQGLISTQSLEIKSDYVLVIQIGSQQLEPLGVATPEEAEDLIFSVGGYFEYRFTEEDILFLQLGPATLFLILSKESYLFQRRQSIENAIRQAQQQRQLGGAPKKLIVPGN